jgi:peptidoglycan/LPS O-acetylase OafA/YrhL
MTSKARGISLWQSKGLVSLDALRGLAALCVAIPHYFIFLKPDHQFLEFVSIVAVEVFFVLSGFVLAHQLQHCIQSDAPGQLRVFYLRRWMRTLPPFIFVLVVLAVSTKNLSQPETLQYLFFVKHFFAVNDGRDYFAPSWSLAVEEWFYLLFPLFLLLMRRLGLGLVRSVVAFFVLLFVLKATYAVTWPDPFQYARRIVILRLDSIAVGFLLYLVQDKVLEWARSRIGVPILLCAVLIALTYVSATERYAMAFVYAAPAFAASLITCFILAERFFAAARIVRTTSAFLANTSYMTYLMHIVVFMYLPHRLFDASPVAHFVVYVAALLGFCAFFFRVVEAPILGARPAYRHSGKSDETSGVELPAQTQAHR